MATYIASGASGATFEEIQVQVAQMQAAGATKESILDLVEQWIAETGIDQLDAEQAHWCLPQILPQKAERNAFTATWTGQVSPPRAGRFLFSVSPIDINKAAIPHETVEHAMKVFVDGQQVVEVNSKEWTWQGAPIQLEAGQPVSLRVELNYSSTDGTYGDSPHALLYWEGPGISRQIVPTEVLTPVQGEGNGLSAEYRWNEGEQQRAVQQQDPSIEFAWATCRDVAPPNWALVTALTQRLWQQATDSEYLSSLLADPPPAKGHVYFRNYTSTQFLSCARRLQFLQIVLQNPRLLDRADQTQILRLYHSLRFGDENAALEVLGTWMQQRPDIEPRFELDFFDTNHRFYRTAALYLVYRTSESDRYLAFQERFLEDPNGQCCLPAAHTLTYCYLMKGRLPEWIAFLDDRLRNESIAGDGRVNWLFARGFAQEIRESSSGRHDFPQLRIGSGMPWLDEAALVAETEGTRARVASQRTARYVSLRMWDEADKEIQAYPDSFAELGLDLARLKREAEQLDMQQRTEVLQERLAELQNRRQLAIERNDSAADSSYRIRIEQLQTEIDQLSGEN
jgi:hypothetical protein